MMAYAVWRILSLPAGSERSRAIMAFFVQLALNALWSWAFFGAHNPGAGLVVILALIVAIVATIRSFLAARPDRRLSAGAVSRWVCYATALNAAIWRLN